MDTSVGEHFGQTFEKAGLQEAKSFAIPLEMSFHLIGAAALVEAYTECSLPGP